MTHQVNGPQGLARGASEVEFTPGPWTPFIAVRGRCKTIAVHQGDVHGDSVVAWPGFDSSSVSLKAKVANARLIAAAPDLYFALQAIVASLAETDEEGLIEHAEQMQNARAALSKARGKQQRSTP